MGYMMNSVQLEGRLTSDPELRYTQGENSFATMRFRLASDNGKDRNGNERPAVFVTCSATGKTAELIDQYCRKGDTVLVEGKIDAGSYTDRNGATQYYTQVNASRVYFVNVTGRDGQRQQGAPAAGAGTQNRQQGARNGGRSSAPSQSGQQRRGGRQGQQAYTDENDYYRNMADGWDNADDETPFR